jgi:lipopolysaccharide export system permease protein
MKHIVIKGRTKGVGAQVEVWYRIGDHVYEAEHLDPNSGRAREITVYQLGDDGFPISRSDASRAWHIGRGVWRMEDPVRIEISGDSLVEVSAQPFAQLGEDIPSDVDTRQMSMNELRSQIREIEEAGHDATALWVDYWSKLASPIACLLLPALALFFAVAGPPHPSSAMTLVLSVIAAVCYVLVTGVGTSLGYGGAVSPFVAGFASTLVFGLLTAYLGLRLRGTGQTF